MNAETNRPGAVTPGPQQTDASTLPQPDGERKASASPGKNDRLLASQTGVTGAPNLTKGTGAGLVFERDDWTLFRSVTGLCQKAGVPQHQLLRLALKELADNALDAAGACAVGCTDGFYFVEDAGPGVDGTPADLARMFSFRRPLSSSKLLRLPTRGALGNGLRVVAGTVLAYGGTLRIRNRGTWVSLSPQDDGSTAWTVTGQDPDAPAGLRVEVTFGPNSRPSETTLAWAQSALWFAGKGEEYRGRTSPHWYDTDSFYELCQAAGKATVRELVSRFEGLSGKKAGDAAAGFLSRGAATLNRAEAQELLGQTQAWAKTVRPERLGQAGREAFGSPGYAKTTGTFAPPSGRGRLDAEVPYVIEAWAGRPDDTDVLLVFVNRTRVTCETQAYRADKRTELILWLGSCSARVEAGRAPLGLMVNITTPYMPIVSDGKEPDFSPFRPAIIVAIEKAARIARRNGDGSAAVDSETVSQKDVVADELDAAIAQVSGSGRHRFSFRQLYYALRPRVMEATGKELAWANFQGIITDIEAARGQDLPGMYRDDRGTLYHPHTGDSIPLGTRMVEAYTPPAWTFNKVLYVEKEGFFTVLQDDRWPERHDCALLTSKGQPTRAARDLLDLLGDTGEPITFFCVHDADGPGTLIYQTLQAATRARGARRVQIVDLGLSAEEALAMGLSVEAFASRNRETPVADGVSDQWRKWYQTQRVELNAMTSPQFIAWLDAKLAGYPGKVVPPDATIETHARETLRERIRDQITEEVLRKANVDAQVERALEEALEAGPLVTRSEVESVLAGEPALSWRDAVDQAVEDVDFDTDGGPQP